MNLRILNWIYLVLGGCVVAYCLLMRVNEVIVPSNERIDISVDGKLNSNESTMINIDLAHRNGIPHRGVWIFLLNELDQVLLLERGKNTITCPNTWTAIGEHTRWNESYEAVAYRALEEEISIHRTEVLDLIPLYRYPVHYEIWYHNNRKDIQWTIPYYVRTTVTSHKEKNGLRLNEESIGGKWIDIHSVIPWLKECPNNQCRLCKMKKFYVYPMNLNHTQSFQSVHLEDRIETSFLHIIEDIILRIQAKIGKLKE